MARWEPLTSDWRRRIRSNVTWHTRHEDAFGPTDQWIKLTYGWHPQAMVYALAYLGAVSTTTPLDLDRVRDSGS